MNSSNNPTLFSSFSPISSSFTKNKKKLFWWGALALVMGVSLENNAVANSKKATATQRSTYSYDKPVEGDEDMMTIMEALKELGHAIKEAAHEKGIQLKDATHEAGIKFEEKAIELYHKLGERIEKLEEKSRERARAAHKEGQKLMADLKEASAEKKEAAKKKVVENLETIAAKVEEHTKAAKAADDTDVTEALKDLGHALKEKVKEKKDDFSDKASDIYKTLQRKMDKLDTKARVKATEIHKEGQLLMEDFKKASVEKKEAAKAKIVENLEKLNKELKK